MKERDVIFSNDIWRVAVNVNDKHQQLVWFNLTFFGTKQSIVRNITFHLPEGYELIK